jgi:valyl-tRNA synthetase
MSASHVQETRETLVHVLDASLRALHPLMPFVTEDLWQRLPKGIGHARSIALAPYPSAETDGAKDLAVDREMWTLQAVISAARTVRSEHELTKKPLPVRVRADRPELLAQLDSHAKAIETLAWTVGSVIVEPTKEDRPQGTVVSAVATDLGAVMVLVGLKGLVTAADEEARIDRELKKIDKDITAIDKKLGSKGFVDRAPAEVIEEARRQKAALSEARDRLLAGREFAKEL